MKKGMLAICIILTLFLGLIPVPSVVVHAEETNWIQGIAASGQYTFDGGDGLTSETAFEISTEEQLAQLAYDVNMGNDYTGRYFKLVNDLDLTGKEWVSIGYRFYPGAERGFNGAFDGNGFRISNIRIGSSEAPKMGGDQTQAGLFGSIKWQSEIRNLHVNGEIYTNQVTCVGLLAGYSESQGSISDCTASGIITSTGSGDLRIGGLIGYTEGTSLTGCSSDVDITAIGAMHAGGLVGYHGAFSYDRIRPLDGGVYTGNLLVGDVSIYGGAGDEWSGHNG